MRAVSPPASLLRTTLTFPLRRDARRLPLWASLLLAFALSLFARPARAFDPGFTYATSNNPLLDCIQADAQLTINTQPREAAVTGCASEVRPTGVGGYRWDYAFADNGTSPVTKYYYGPYRTSGGGGCGPRPPAMSEADAIAACQAGRSNYLTQLRASLASNHFVCSSPAVDIRVDIRHASSNPAATGEICADIGALSGKSWLNGNWACAAYVGRRLASDDPRSAVPSRIDFVQNGQCLARSASGVLATASCASPAWVAEPLAIDTYRLRAADSTGLCVELATSPPQLQMASCRAQADPNLQRQAWTFPIGADGSFALASSGFCLGVASGQVTPAACDGSAPQKWQPTVAPYPQEHWRDFSEYLDTSSRPARYVYTDGASTGTLVQNAVFVALTEPAADAIPVYRGALGRLTTCKDDSVPCGELAFFAPLPPDDGETTVRVPIYEFVSVDPNRPTTYRYSAQLDLGPAFARQPDIAFFAYPNHASTLERVTEILDRVQSLASALGVTAMPKLVSDTSRDGSAGYALSGGNLVVSSSGVEQPDREELLHVLGHATIEALMGAVGDDDVCTATPADGVVPPYHRPRDRFAASQVSACAFREGWTEFFTSQVLHTQARLAAFETGGIDGVVQHPGRRLFAPAFAALVIYGAATLAAEVFILHTQTAVGDVSSRTPLLTRVAPVVQAIAALPKRPDIALADMAALSSACADSVAAAFARQPTAAIPATEDDFPRYLELESQPACQIIDPDDNWIMADCQTPRVVLCGNTDGSAFALTKSTYPPTAVTEACIVEFGPLYAPVTSTRKRLRIDYRALNNTGARIPWATGEGQDRSKRLRRLPPAKGIAQATAAANDVTALLTSTDYDYLLVHSLNVGAGSCNIVQCVGGPSVFVDCGSLGSDEVIQNAAAVRYYANAVGVFHDNAILKIVSSHPHADHYGYLRNVFTGQLPSAIWAGGAMNGYAGWFQAWLTSTRTAGYPVNGSTTAVQEWPAASTGVATFAGCGGASLDMVVVNQGGTGLDHATVNRNSAVLALTLSGRFLAVLPGDATAPTETAVIGALAPTPITYTMMRFLAAPHHGAEGDVDGLSNTQNWVDFVQPTHLVYSAGTFFGHPRCNIVDRYTGAGTLAASAAHSIACGTGGAAWGTRPVQARQYSTRGSGIVVAGIAIPKAGSTAPWQTIFYPP